MATEQSVIKNTYPLPSYNYKVTIASTKETITLACTEVSGLQTKFDTVTFKQSPGADHKGAGPVIMHMLGQGTPTTLSLKRAVILNEHLRYIYNWFASVKANVVDKRDVEVHLMDEAGTQIVGWRVINAMPMTLDAPTFTASSNDAAIESVELFSDGVEMILPKS